MELAIFAVAVAAVGAIVYFFSTNSLGRPSFARKKHVKSAKKAAGCVDSTVPKCPLCGSALENGNVMHSKIVGTGGNLTAVRLCYVFGCTKCKAGGLERRCPVCKKLLQSDEFLFARVFADSTLRKDHTDTRPHVIINGCPHCRKSRSS